MPIDARKSAEQGFDVENVIEQFEQQWSNLGDAQIEDFLTAVPEKCLTEVTVELVRADMEFRWDTGKPIEIAQYFERFPQLEKSLDARQSVAFEDYRQKTQHGVATSMEEYQSRFEVDVAEWPAWSPSRPTVAADSKAGPLSRRPIFPQLGSTFLGFKLIAELGRGAFGRVYLARQGDLADRFVAIKLTVERSDESQRLAKLQHSNIVPVYSIHEHSGLYAICMPFLGLITLRDVIKEKGGDSSGERSQISGHLISTVAANRLSTLNQRIHESLGDKNEDDVVQDQDTENHFEAISLLSGQELAVWIVAHIAGGLAYAHDHGIVHGDLKPENILISDDGQPLILDFHLSRSKDRSLDTSMLVGGTLPYLSEQHLVAIRDHGSIDHQCDIFSLGVMLYELVFGKRPYPDRPVPEDEQFKQLIEDRQNTPNLETGNISVSPDLQTVIRKCLAPNPLDRYVDANHLQEDLQRHLNHLPLKHAPNRSPVERCRKFFRRHPHLKQTSTIVATITTILIFVAALLWIRTSQLKRAEFRQASLEFREDMMHSRIDLLAHYETTQPFNLAIQRANELLDENGANDGKQWLDARQTMPLSNEALEAETSELALLNFWMANAYLELASHSPDPPQAKEFANLARTHNLQARQLFGNDRIGLRLQESRIAQGLGETPSLIHLDQELKRASSTMDDADSILIANHYVLNGQFPKAIEILTPVVQNNPQDYSYWMLLGGAFGQMGNHADAEACYTICVFLDKDSSIGWLQRGITRLGSGNLPGAISDFDACLVLAPNDTTALANRGLALRNLGQWRDSDRDFTAALQNGATQTRIYYLRSQVRQQLGMQDEAKSDSEEFIRLTPSDDLSWITRGIVYLQAGDIDQAFSDFQSAAALNPQSTFAFQNMANIQAEQLGNTTEAIESMSSLIQLRPADPKAIATRGVLYARTEDHENALADAEKALAINQDADTLYRVAGIYALLSKTHPEHAETAENLIARSIWLSPPTVAKYIKDDSDLDALKSRERFGELQNLIEQLSDQFTPNR